MAGKHSFGTSLEYRVQSVGGSYSQIGDVIDVDADGDSVTSCPVPDLLMTNAVMRKIPGNVDCGKVKFTLQFNKTNFQNLRAQRRVMLDFRSVVPGTDGGTLTWSGFLTKIPITIPNDAPISHNVETEVDGDFTWTPAA